ncbi:hypothetical protein [Actinomadura gamaensis]|uniref:Uncharacterized protein n=1 Tax=Actinomadura gamaensis TaxID=1763541 RepID=A0ABV9U645_9ACTN
MAEKGDRDGTVTVVRHPAWERLLVATGFPLLGALAGWLLKLLANWAESWPWIPWEGPVKLIDGAPEPWATIGALVVGAVAGGVIVLLAEHGYVTVTVADDQVTLARGDSRQTVPRSAVAGVFLDGKRLVVLGADGRELAVESKNEGADLPDASLLAAGFRAHGYPWLPDGDPHKDEYMRWVEDVPGLPPAGNALLKARAKALDKGDEKEIAELRGELARLGVVVRDDGKRQWWRVIDGADAR